MNVDLAGLHMVVAGAGAFADTLNRSLAGNDGSISQHEQGANVLLDALIIHMPPIASSEIAGLVDQYSTLLAARSGRILIVTSATGLVPVRGNRDASAEASSALSLTRSMAIDLAPRGVCVNALALGAIEGDPLNLVSHTALGRAGNFEEAAAAALFLLDPENTYMTGQVLAVDGGWTAGYTRDF